MRTAAPIFTVLPFTLAACAGGGPPAPPSLSYSLPDPATATYVRGDTLSMDIDAGGQTFQALASASGTFATTFTRAADGVRVSVAVQKFSGTLTQPMQDPMTVDESAIQGPLVFTLDRRGAATVLSAPKVSQPADRLFQPLSYANSFFPRLPGGPAMPGSSWTDTIRFDGPAEGGTVKETSVVTYSVSGDTLVGGRSLLRIALRGTAQQSAQGSIADMDADFSRTLKSDLSGWVLWDVARRLMVESYTSSDGRGTMSVSMAPEPMDVRVRQVSRARLGGGL